MLNLLANEKWANVPIEDGTPNIDMNRVAVGENNAASILVRFPAGWRRDAMGHYLCDEEFVVLKGALHLTDHVLKAGDYGFVPAGVQRYGSFTEEETWAFAWFGARPAWVRDAVKDETAHEKTVKVTLSSAQPGLLRPATSLLPALYVGMAGSEEMEILDVENGTWEISNKSSAHLLHRVQWVSSQV